MAEPDDSKVPTYLQSHTDRLCQNLTRVDSLINLHSFAERVLDRHQELPADSRQGSGQRLPEVDDVLRAAVVLLQASLEDFLRTIASCHLSRTDQDLLNKFPLAGIGKTSLMKFGLGDLIGHRGKTIDEVIEMSIDKWLHQKSFSKSTDLANMLKTIGIDPGKCNQSFPLIDNMVTRRHRIVHNADRSPNSDGPDASETLPIDSATVQVWRDAVQQFMKDVLYNLQYVVQDDCEEAK